MMERVFTLREALRSALILLSELYARSEPVGRRGAGR